MLTPYQFASNRPIDGIDLDGLEWEKGKTAQDYLNENVALDPDNIRREVESEMNPLDILGLMPRQVDPSNHRDMAKLAASWNYAKRGQTYWEFLTYSVGNISFNVGFSNFMTLFKDVKKANKIIRHSHHINWSTNKVKEVVEVALTTSSNTKRQNRITKIATFLKDNLDKPNIEINKMLKSAIDYSKGVKVYKLSKGTKVYRYERVGVESTQKHFFTMSDVGTEAVGFGSGAGYKLKAYELLENVDVLDTVIKGSRGQYRQLIFNGSSKTLKEVLP